jgi:amino acid transporter
MDNDEFISREKLVPTTFLILAPLMIVASIGFWTTTAGIAVVVFTAMFAAVGVTRMQSYKKARLPYVVFQPVSDRWFTALMALSLSGFFGLVTVFSIAEVGDIATTILSMSAPIAFMVYMLVAQHHHDESTIYDAFSPKEI